jgi:shikimate kinase
MGDHVLLVGMMGAGKSTVGRIVADRMRRPFRDSDADVERRTGQSVPEIFAARGERAFRAEERAALCAALASGVPSVIAVAGGAVLDPEARRRLRSAGVVVWLDVPPHELAGRIGTGRGRPLLETDPSGALCRLDAVRRPVYRELADVVLRVAQKRPDALAGEVVTASRARLQSRCVREGCAPGFLATTGGQSSW